MDGEFDDEESNDAYESIEGKVERVGRG